MSTIKPVSIEMPVTMSEDTDRLVVLVSDGDIPENASTCEGMDPKITFAPGSLIFVNTDDGVKKYIYIDGGWGTL